MPKPPNRIGYTSPRDWRPGYQAMDWQGALVVTPYGPAVQDGDYYFDTRRGVAVLVRRRPGLIWLWPFYADLADRARELLAELEELRSEVYQLHQQRGSEEQILQLALRGLEAEARLDVVRRVYEDAGLHCLGSVTEALALYGYDMAIQVHAEDGLMSEVSSYPFHFFLAQAMLGGVRPQDRRGPIPRATKKRSAVTSPAGAG